MMSFKKRVCKKCGEEKVLIFAFDGRKLKNGNISYRWICRDCMNYSLRKGNRTTPRDEKHAKQLEYQRQYYQRNKKEVNWHLDLYNYVIKRNEEENFFTEEDLEFIFIFLKNVDMIGRGIYKKTI